MTAQSSTVWCNQLCEPILTPSLPRSWWCWFALCCFFLNGWLFIAGNEHRWDEVKSLKGLSGQHMQPSPRCTTASCLPPWLTSHLLLPSPALALVVKGLLPARGGRLLLLLELPRPLKGALSINRDCNSLNRARGSLKNTKQEATPNLPCSSLSQFRKMHSI